MRITITTPLWTKDGRRIHGVTWPRVESIQLISITILEPGEWVDDADEWYAAEVLRMRERSPA